MTIQYDPQKVTDWVTPLEKVYARQSDQLDRYHDQLRERDQQEREATLDLPEMFSKLASFSSSISSLVDARKANKKKIDAENQQAAKVKWLSTVKDTDRPEAVELIKWRTEEANLKAEFGQFKDKVLLSEKLGKISPEVAKLLLDEHGANIVYYQQIIGQQKVDNGIHNVTTGFEGDEDRQREWSDLKRTNNIEGQKTYVSNYLINELKDLNISDELIAEKYIDQITTLANTKGTLSKIKVKNKLLSADNVKYAERFNLVRKQGGNLSVELSNQIKESNKDSVHLNLYRQAEIGELTEYELADMRTGYVKHDAGDIIVTEKNKQEYPGFEVGDKLGKGELLFSPDKWKVLEAQVDSYTSSFYTASIAGNKAQIKSDFVNYTQGNMTEAEKSAALSRFIKNGGKNTDAEYKAFENAQRPDPVVAEIEQKRLLEIDVTGRPGQYEDEVKNMSQIDFVKWEEDKNAYEANREQNGFDKKTSDTFATNLMKADLGFDISALGKGLIPGTQTEIRDWISARRDQIYATVYNDPTQNRKTIGKTTDALLKQELTQLGFYASNDREDADFGILTSDGQGGFPGWEAEAQSKIERSKGTNPARTVRNVLNEFQEYGTLNNLLQNGKGITNAELKAVVDNIKDSKLTSFPPDVLLKARIFGIQPSTLIISKLEYLENPNAKKRDKDFIKRFDVNPKELKESIPSTDIEIREVIEGINDGRTLLSYYNKRGIVGLSPNQLNHIIREADKQRVAVQKEKEELEKEIEETRTMQTPDTQIGRYNTRS